MAEVTLAAAVPLLGGQCVVNLKVSWIIYHRQFPAKGIMRVHRKLFIRTAICPRGNMSDRDIYPSNDTASSFNDPKSSNCLSMSVLCIANIVI